MVAYAGSCANLIFSGALGGYGAVGMMAALVSSIVSVLVLSQFSSFPLSLGGPDSNPSAILAVTVGVIASSIVGSAGGDRSTILPTVILFLCVSALGCGLFLVWIGERRFGRLVRYIPHPVIGGFLGGTGYLLVAGGYKMLTGVGLGPDGWERLRAVPPMAVGTALFACVAMLVLVRVARHHLVIPGVLLASLVAFYVWLHAAGGSVAGARHLGLLMDPIQLRGWSNTMHFSYGLVRWDLVLAHWNDFAVMTMVVIITCLLNATSIDVALGTDVEIDRELRALGLANILCGLTGGIVAVNSFNRTILNQRSGASSRWAARFCAIGIALVMLAAPGAIGLIPRPVLTGLILYLGFSLLISWIWDARATMPTSDYVIVLAIIGIIAALGVMPGVLLGIVIACVNLVFAFSKSPAVKYAFTAANRRSNVERKPHENRALSDSGTALRGFVLQGFLFFGTASTVLDEIRKVLDGARFVLLDFWLVREIDSSSVIALKKIRNLSVDKGVTLVICGVSPRLETRMRRASFNLGDPLIRRFPDLDHGLEWCEDAIIAGQDFTAGLFTAFSGILRRFREGPMGEQLKPVFFPAGAQVVAQGAASDSLFIVDHGQVSVHLRGESKAGAYRRRLRSYGEGTVLGEMGFYTGDLRSADIVADVDSTLLVLTREAMTALEKESPMAAHEFHRYVIYTLALRLRSANEEIRLLL
jgi:SulP family sulfate permease